MNHIFQNANFGENWFSFPLLYKEFVDISNDGSKIVEVGCWKGKSTAYLAVEIINSKKDIKFYAVDTWQGSPEHQNNSEVINNTLYDIFLSNIEPVKDAIIPIKMPSIEAASYFEDNELDIVFIDASHYYDDVKSDILAWLPKVKSGGIIAGHDYVQSWPDVIKVVNEIFGKENLRLQERCWVYKKI